MNTIEDLYKWEKAKLPLMWNADWSLDQIAAKFRLGIDELESYLASFPGWPDLLQITLERPKVISKKRIIRDFLKKGWTIREIHQTTGIPEAYVRNTRDDDLKAMGLLTPKKRIRAEVFEILQTRPELSPREIAARLKTSLAYVYNLQSQLKRAQDAKSHS